MVVLAALQNAHAVADGDQRVGREIVERADLFGVARGQVPVHAAERQVITKALDVVAQRLDDGAVLGLFRDLLRGAPKALEHFFASAVREGGQHLRRGQDGQGFDVLRAALGRHVEFAHRVDLVVEKLDAHGRAQRRPDVENAAAQRELADALDGFRARVAAFDKLFRKRAQIKAVAERNVRHRAAQRVGRQRSLHQAVDGRDQDRRFSGGEAAQRADALLLPAVGRKYTVAQLPFAREQQAHVLAEQLVQVARHAVCLVFVRADD